MGDETSQLDHTRLIGGDLPSSNEVPNTIGQPSHADLLLTCNGGSLKAGLAWPAFLGSEDVHVRWRLDDGAIVDDHWAVSDNGDDAVVPGAAKTRAFIDAVAHAKRLVVDADAYRSGSSEAVFDLDGAASVAAKVEEACPSKSG